MKLLLTNDDGIDAPGIAALEAVAREIGQCVTVAPHQALSGCSHQTTTARPLRLHEVADGRFHLDGTPADCARIGLLHVEPDVDWVLSGINDGGNLGVDVHMSGTVAAAREATLLGFKAIALSHYRTRSHAIDWAEAGRVVGELTRELMSRPLPAGAYWNVNLPAVPWASDSPEVVFSDVDANPLPVSFRDDSGEFHYSGDYHARQRNPGTDVDVCFSGKIAVSVIQAAP